MVASPKVPEARKAAQREWASGAVLMQLACVRCTEPQVRGQPGHRGMLPVRTRMTAVPLPPPPPLSLSLPLPCTQGFMCFFLPEHHAQHTIKEGWRVCPCVSMCVSNPTVPHLLDSQPHAPQTLSKMDTWHTTRHTPFARSPKLKHLLTLLL